MCKPCHKENVIEKASAFLSKVFLEYVAWMNNRVLVSHVHKTSICQHPMSATMYRVESIFSHELEVTL